MNWLVKPRVLGVQPLDDRDPGGGGGCEEYDPPCETQACTFGSGGGCVCDVSLNCLQVMEGVIQIPE